MTGLKTTRWFTRLASTLISVAALAFPMTLVAQGVSISGQAINASGQPAAYAQLIVCPYVGGGGVPCSPKSSLYSDPAMTQSVPNPYTSDQLGNYSVFVTPGSYYIVQLSVGSQTYYSYLISTAAGSGGGTVSSVGLSMPSWLSVANTPITSSGILAVTPATGQTSHQVIGTCGTTTIFAPCTLTVGDLPGSGLITLGTSTVAVGGTLTTADNFNITGNAATASSLAATPTLCPTGQSPLGILANGNATGCASANGVVLLGPSGSQTIANSSGGSLNITGAAGDTGTQSQLNISTPSGDTTNLLTATAQGVTAFQVQGNGTTLANSLIGTNASFTGQVFAGNSVTYHGSCASSIDSFQLNYVNFGSIGGPFVSPGNCTGYVLSGWATSQIALLQRASASGISSYVTDFTGAATINLDFPATTPSGTCPSAGGGAPTSSWRIDSAGKISYCLNGTGSWAIYGGGSSGVASLTGDTNLFSNSASTGAVTLTPRTAAQNSFLAGPSSGGTGAYSFRAITSADVPALNQNTTGNAATASSLAATPTLCPTGQSPLGILANGNATGCASSGYSGGVVRVNGFGDSKMAGTFTSGPTTSFFGQWASTFYPSATVNNTAISGQSCADVATQVFGTTFLPTDLNVLADGTNDSVVQGGAMGNTPSSQYLYCMAALAAYMTIPDGQAVGGYPSKIPASVATYSGTCTTSTHYPVVGTGTAMHCAEGASTTINFVGDRLYIGTETNQSYTGSITVSLDSGTTTQTFGLLGSSGNYPYLWTYYSHLNSYAFSPFLLVMPTTTGGKDTYHTATITCSAGTFCDFDYFASNAVPAETSGPNTYVLNLEQEGGDTSPNSLNSKIVNQSTDFIAAMFARHGLNTNAVDVSGCLNYYAGPNINTTGTWTTSSTIIAVASTAGINVGMGIFLASDPTNYFVTAIGTGTITLNSNPASGTGGAVTGNANWAQALHEDIAGAAAKAQCLGRATNQLVSAQNKTQSRNDTYTVSFSYPAFNSVVGAPGYATATWLPPVPVVLTQMNIAQVGVPGSCASSTALPSVKVAAAVENQTATAFFSTATPPAITGSFAGQPFFQYGDTLEFLVQPYVGCVTPTTGNVTLNVTATFKPQ